MTVRLILKQLLWAIGLWFLIAAVSVYMWYFSIPVLFAVVCIISFALRVVRGGNAAPACGTRSASFNVMVLSSGHVAVPQNALDHRIVHT